ncbi:MAG TPA: hypothetical protein VGH38_35745 [Bryobacteraceae bacterium]|jgi:hypothetical protein
MALFTDGPVSCILDLTARDTQLLNVAVAEGIDVTQKLALAQDELALELTTLLNRLSYTDQAFWLPPQADLGSVVVTPALKLWHTLRSLELVYADAYNNQLNDRYAGKRDQFHRQAESAYEKLIQIGLGIASCPVPQPATANIVAAPGPYGTNPLPDGTYYVTTAWVNSQGEEGASAVPSAVATSRGTFLVPSGSAPRNATGWNVYVGTAPEAMSLQNSSPLAAGQTWLQPGTLTSGGRAPGAGQSPSYIKPVPRMLQRG